MNQSAIKPHKRRFKHPTQHLDLEHVDEKWLVSYSDMMTLLFGLFVMLYSLAVEHQGSMYEKMKELSESAFLQTKEANTTVQPQNISPEELLRLQKLIDEIQKKLTNSETRGKEISDQLTAILKEKKDLLHELELLKIRLEQSEKSTPIPSKRNLANLEEEKLIIEEELKKTKSILVEKNSTIDELKAKMAKKYSHLAIYIKWTTESSDLDMLVTDPNQRTFSYKKTKLEGADGEFLLDSRSGPGIELWQSNKVIPGTYTVEVKLYNQYNRNEEPNFDLYIITGANKIKKSTEKMNIETKRIVKFQFVVTAEDTIQFKE